MSEKNFGGTVTMCAPASPASRTSTAPLMLPAIISEGILSWSIICLVARTAQKGSKSFLSKAFLAKYSSLSLGISASDPPSRILPQKRLTYFAPARAAITACVTLMQAVQFTEMPELLKFLMVSSSFQPTCTLMLSTTVVASRGANLYATAARNALPMMPAR